MADLEPLRPAPPGPAYRGPPRRASVAVGSLWMVGLSVLLFFLPAINGLVGGLVGGYKVGGVGRAVGAALLPGAVVALVLWLVLAVFDLPVVGAFAGLAVAALIVVSEIGLLVGAVIGGVLGAGAARRPLRA